LCCNRVYCGQQQEQRQVFQQRQPGYAVVFSLEDWRVYAG
jgi:hypothetical protein